MAEDRDRGSNRRRGPVDYYLDPDEPPERWLGRGRDALGLTGEVRGEELRLTLDRYGHLFPKLDEVLTNRLDQLGRQALLVPSHAASDDPVRPDAIESRGVFAGSEQLTILR